MLTERTGGKLNLREYKTVDDVAELRQHFGELGQKRGRPLITAKDTAWSERFDRCQSSLAKRGLLKSFVLKDGDRPVACIFGFQYGKTFLLGSTLHDPEYDDLSPGVALLHLVIERLIQNEGVTSINLGYGVPAEHRSTNVVLKYMSFWLFPKTPLNRLMLACYLSLKRSVAAFRSLKYRRTQSRACIVTATNEISRFQSTLGTEGDTGPGPPRKKPRILCR
jgi:hypothetical protein